MIPDLVSLVQTRLNWGRDRAVTIGELAETMNLSRRAIEKAIETLRATGAPVCSGTDGIWLTTDAGELERQVEALRRRAIHQLIGARALRLTARRYRKQVQTQLWDGA
jgi:biotin operon repressor